MGGPSPLHVEHFRENERSWNDRAQEPIAVFIGFSPPGTYFRCFELHSKDNVDCRELSSNGFGRAVLNVVALSGYELVGYTKKARVESLSQRFCVVDIFESVYEINTGLRQMKKGKTDADSLVGPAATETKLIAMRCRDQGWNLPVIAALGACLKPKYDSGQEIRIREFRWLLWESLRKNVEADFRDSVAFKRWDDAYLFGMQKGDGGSKDRWMSYVRDTLSKAIEEDRRESSRRYGD